MSTRTAVLLASLALIAFLAYGTVRALVDGGSTLLVAVSLLILALLGFGVIGALTAPPEE